MRHWGSIILWTHCRQPATQDVEPSLLATHLASLGLMQIFQLIRKFFNQPDGVIIIIIIMVVAARRHVASAQIFYATLLHFFKQKVATKQQLHLTCNVAMVQVEMAFCLQQ